MAIVLHTTKAAAYRGRFPHGPVVLNKDSLQAQGLLFWAPLKTNFFDYGPRKIPIDTANQTFGANRVDNAGFLDPKYGMRWGNVIGFNQSTALYTKHLVPNLTNPYEVTLTGWCANLGNTWEYMLNYGRDSNSANNGLQYTLSYHVENQGRMMSWGPDIRAASSPTPTPNNGAHFMAGVVRSSSLIEYYEEAELVGVNTDPQTPQVLTGQMCVVMGNRRHDLHPQTSHQNWGTDYRVYDRALHADEIAAMFDPETRFELYWQPGATYFFPGVRELRPAALAIGTDTTDPGIVIEPELTIGPFDLQSGALLSEPDLVVEAEPELTIDQLASGTQLDESELVVEQPDTLIISDLHIGTELSDATIVIEGELALDIAPIQIGSALDDVTGQLGELIDVNPLNLGTQLTEAVIPITDLFPQALELGSQLDTAVIFVEGITVDGELLEVVPDDKTVIISPNRRRRTIL